MSFKTGNKYGGEKNIYSKTSFFMFIHIQSVNAEQGFIFYTLKGKKKGHTSSIDSFKSKKSSKLYQKRNTNVIVEDA